MSPLGKLRQASSTALLESEGEIFILPVGATRIFDDPESVWIIRDGRLDFLAIRREDGEQSGPREHLAGLTSGALIWGIEQSAEEDGVHVMALATEETGLLRLPVTRLAQLARDPRLCPLLAEGLDSWIAALSQGASRRVRRGRESAKSLAVGETLVLDEAVPVNCRRGVAWVRMEEGDQAYLDLTEIVSQGADTRVPLTAQTWLEPKQARPIEGEPTEAVLGTPGFDARMELFHGWVYRALAQGFRNAAENELTRLASRKEQVADDTERTFVGFSSLLGDETAGHHTTAREEAVFTCCAAIGRELGIPVVMPARVTGRRRGDRPLSVEDIAEASQIRVRQVMLRGRWWKGDSGPFVGFVGEENRPVALLPRPGDRYVLFDPASGQEQPVTSQTAAEVSVLAWSFYPNLPGRPLFALDLVRFCLARCKADLWALAGTGALGGLIATGIPLATGYVFDTVIPGHQVGQILQVGLAMLAAVFAAVVFHFATDVAQLRVEGKISANLQAAVMDRLLRLPSTFFAAFSSGDLARRAMAIELIRRQLSGVVLGSLVSGVFSVFSFGLLFLYAPIVAVLAWVLSSLLAVIAIIAGTRLMKAVMETEERAGRINGLVLEICSGIAKLRLAGAEDRAFNVWGAKFREMRLQEVAARKVVNTYSVVWSGFEVLCLAAIFGAIAKLSGDTVSTGGFLAFVAAFTAFLTEVSALCLSLLSLFAAVPSYRRAEPILRELPESDLTKSDPGRLRGEVEANNVAFRYSPDTRLILDGVTIRAEPGEFVAITGASGSGKSTLARLLLGFERPESGGVFFDGQDLRGLDLRRVRSQIGVVLQNGRLMPGSIYENIKGAAMRATLEECWEAAAQVGLDEEIQAMPMGMHTMLTEGAATLSGGQVQRIMVARAIIGRPRLLIMDEATSALDNRTQAIVTESLDRLSVTRVIIAHRLSTIINADRIYVLAQGRVFEVGTYQQLLAKNGLFADLVRRQQT